MKHDNNKYSDIDYNEKTKSNRNNKESRFKHQKPKLINSIYDFSYNNSKEKNRRKNLNNENERKTNKIRNLDSSLNKKNNFIYVRKYLQTNEKSSDDKINNLSIYQFKAFSPNNLNKKKRKFFNSQNSNINSANNNNITLNKDNFLSDYTTKIFYSSQENFSPPQKKILYNFNENNNNFINIHCGDINEKDTTSDSEKIKNNKKNIIENLNNNISVLEMRIELLKNIKKEKSLESLKSKIECQKLISKGCMDTLNMTFENDFIKLINQKKNLKIQLSKKELDFLKKGKHNEIIANENLEFNIKKIGLIDEILNAKEKIENYYKFHLLNNNDYTNSDESIEEQTIKDYSMIDYLETINHKTNSSLVEDNCPNKRVSNQVNLFHAKFILNNKLLKK